MTPTIQSASLHFREGKNAQADQKYAAALDLLVADLTKEGKIEEAKLLLQHKNRPTKAVAQEPEIDVKPPVVAPPPVAPKPAAGPGSIIGTTWRIQNAKGFTITFLADGQIKEGTADIGLHTYEIIDANKVRIRWGKTSGRFEKKNYEIDGMRTTMKGIADGSEWKRIGDAIE